MNPHSVLANLLGRRDSIAAVNRLPRTSGAQDMPPDVMAWFGVIAIAVAKKWNSAGYTVTDSELYAGVAAGTSGVVESDKWAKAVNTLCEPGPMHFLLRSDQGDEFIINQPGLETFWQSPQAPALLYLHGGEPSSIRPPASAEERDWVEWLQAFNRDMFGARHGASPVPAAGSAKLDLVGTSARAATPIAPEGVSFVRNLALAGRYAYVIAPREGVRIYDVATPASPTLLSVIPYPYDPAWFEPLGQVGILRASSAGVVLVDLSNPVEPKTIYFDNFYNCRFNNCGLALLSFGTTVVDLCHSEGCGVRLFDFTNPAAVADVGTIHFAAGTATFHRNYLILGNYKAPSIKAVELRAGGVRELQAMPLDTDKGSIIPKAISAVAERLYVIGERSNRPVFTTFNLEHFPEETRPLGEQKVESIRALFGVQMTQDGQWLCLADGGRVTLFDLTDLDNPKVAATLEGPFQAATVHGDRVYASDARDVWIYGICATP